MTRASYAIAIGSNRRGRHGSPTHEVAAALLRFKYVVAASPIITTRPLGPSQRSFANAVAVIESKADPAELMQKLQRIQYDFGRRAGRRWGPRVIDLDIILWSGGTWVSDAVVVPHIAFRDRQFVLEPLAAVVPNWRDPLTGLSMRQLRARLTRRRPLH